MGGGSATALISHVKQIMTTRKAIALGLLTTAVVTLLAFGIKHKAFKTTTPNANKRVEVKAENTLTDLTNTTWQLNDTLSNLTPSGRDIVNDAGQQWTEYYAITFTSNSVTYYEIDFIRNVSINIAYRGPTNITVYNYTSNTWANNNYKLVKFVGGTNTTNTNLINWLFNNATQITITDLTNTSWKLNYELEEITASYLLANINFYNNGNLFNQIALGYDGLNSASNCISYGTSRYIMYRNGQWDIGTTYRQASRIYITGGTDKSNLTLIIWLFKNATQYQQNETLQNTKWTFVDNPKPQQWNYTFNINFTSNKKSCNGLKAGTTNNTLAYSYKTDNDVTPYAYYQVYNGSQWANTNWQTIIIISGDDVESLSLINFLTCNADGTSYQPIPNNADQYDIENGNFVSLQSLMIQILTMPFTFISQAFNVTLWPNTAWEFNLSNFILAIIAIASLIFIIKLFTSGFSVIGNYTRNKDDREFKRSQTRLNNAKTKKIEGKKDKE